VRAEITIPLEFQWRGTIALKNAFVES